MGTISKFAVTSSPANRIHIDIMKSFKKMRNLTCYYCKAIINLYKIQPIVIKKPILPTISYTLLFVAINIFLLNNKTDNLLIFYAISWNIQCSSMI